MRRTQRHGAPIAAALLALLALLGASFIVAAPPAEAQNDAELVDQVAIELERDGFFIESGGEGSTTGFASLVRQGERADDNWYFVSMADAVPDDFADDLRDDVSPQGNVLVYFIDADGFVNVQLASNESESIESRALAPFDGDWEQPEDFMTDVITEFDALAGVTSSSGSSSAGPSASSDSGGGFPWWLFFVPLLIIGAVWFMMSRGKTKEREQDELETAQKIRAELQTELDELANDVLVLSGPVDLSDKPEAVNYYREATDTYLTISDELPDAEKLEDADIRELSALGTRVAHARWQMDAAEALIDGEPIPEKPKVAPPPPAPKPPTPRAEQRRQMPQRQARPRVPYSKSRRRSGGGLLDILIAGAGSGMLGGRSRGRSRGRSGGMFGGGSRSRGRSGGSRNRRQSNPRRGGGVFGGGSSSRSSGRSSSRRSNRTRSSSNRRSTSRRRRRRSSARHS